MEEPFLSKDKETQKNLGKASNFAKYLVKGGLDAIILSSSILVSSVNCISQIKTQPQGIDLEKVIYFGIPIIIANAVTHSICNAIVTETETEAKELRSEIEGNVKENVTFGERGSLLSSSVVYFSMYIVFGFFVLLPFLIAGYYAYSYSQFYTIIWFFVIALIELTTIAVVKSGLTKRGFWKSFWEVILVGVISVAVTLLFKVILRHI